MTRCNNLYRGAFNAWVYASRIISCFLQQTWPIHYFRSKTLVLDGSTPFCCLTRPAAKISIGVHLKHEFVARKPFLVWSQRTCSIHNFRSKTHVSGGSMPFCSRTWHVAITCIEAHLMHGFMPLEPFLVFLQQTCPIHYFRTKSRVLDGFMTFCCGTRPAAKISIGVY